ncbi:MAG: hypothetical protein HKO59_09670 [Phycisphaerales bacterium]|nr:hypothetical protein [Phycisphaerae bacterium]NNF41857.1 hypothetical protein [Phycisphaerales bacterium]NNM26231.1 hypothetical protein [Phycisphaerales bacterium]
MLVRLRCVAALAVAAVIGTASPAYAGGAGCDADIDGSGVVDFPDLLTLLASWGPCPGCPADLDGNGDVDFVDLLSLLAAWDTVCADDFVAMDVVGELLDEYPHFQMVKAFNEVTPILIAIDPHAHPSIVGAAANAYVVASKTAAEWDGDPSLTDVRGAPQVVGFGGPDIQDATVALSGSLSGNGGTEFGIAYDLVVDMDMNGELGPGDFIDGYDADGFRVVRKFTAGGPLTVTTVTYSGGSFLAQRTYYPTDIASMGQLPLVIMSHGNGHQYTWYDYLGEYLASYGFIFMSHQNNTVPGIETASTTTLTNTDYLLGNLGTIAGGVLAGHVQTDRIAWLGHSRGGEGVARAYDRLFDGTYTPSNFTIDDIKLVSSIAPTDFLGTNSANPHGVEYHLLYGSADGDVSGAASCRICQSFSLLERATGFRASTYVQGADHNDFNCCGFNDFTGPASTQIGRPEAQSVAKTAYLALLRHRWDGVDAAMDYITRQYEDIRPTGVQPDTIVDHEYKDSASSIVIDDFQSQTSTSVSSSGGAVAGDVSNRIENRLDDANSSFSWTTADPMNGMTRGRSSDSTRGTVFDWNSDRFLQFSILPAIADWSDRTTLSFRACQGTRHPNTTAVQEDLTFTVTLVDGSGTSSSINIGAYGGGLEEPYQRVGDGSGVGWGNEFEVIRIRLADFLVNGSGLDLSDIEAVRFEFGPSFGSSVGRIGMDDIEVTN